MRISTKVDYAVRATAELASAPGRPVPAVQISEVQGIPLNFLEHLLEELEEAGVVRANGDPVHGFELNRPAEQVTISDVMQAVEGPLAAVRGEPPEEFSYPGAARVLPRVWGAVRESLTGLLEQVTIADVASGQLPPAIDRPAAPV